MKRTIAVVGTLFVVALGNIFGFAPDFAQAHKPNYCKHGIKYWWAYPPAGHPIKYRIGYVAGGGYGPHLHTYVVQYRIWNTFEDRYLWWNLHFHTRRCNVPI